MTKDQLEQAIKNIEQLIDDREEVMLRQPKKDSMYLASGQYSVADLKKFIQLLEDPHPRM
jgi:hypothetical protein